MKHSTVLVLSDPNEQQLAMLDRLPEGTSLAIGNHIDAFDGTAAAADVVFSWSKGLPLLRDVLQKAPNVKWVHSRAAGLDSILYPELIESPIPLTNGSGVFSQSLGEFAIAAALYFAKDFRRMMRNQAAGRWEQFDVEEIRGTTMGIVGYGDIGRACASRARAMGMRVLAVRRHPGRSAGDDLVQHVYPMDQMLEMLSHCDYVVAAAPLTPDTKGLLGEAAFAAMKSTAVVMNIGRGPVIDEAALIRALEAGRIRGAALDVFEKEPLPADSPLYRLENVLLSPHCADHTATWLEDAMQFFIDQFERYRNGEPLKNVVNKRLGY